MVSMISFTTTPTTGSGRGRSLGTPTINVELDQIPDELEHGVYAVTMLVDELRYHAVMHYGPRPVFNDSISCEVHLLDITICNVPTSLEVHVIERIRDIQNFDGKEKLVQQIHTDIDSAHAILEKYERTT